MRRLLLLILFLFSLPALAQTGLEIIPLKHRTHEQVLPVLRPLVEAGGSISGANNKIFVRASAANRAQIRQALAAIDTPVRRLVITVAQENDAASDAQGTAVSGRVGGGAVQGRIDGGRDERGLVIRGEGRDASIRAQTYGTRDVSTRRVRQEVQVIEGGQALIRTGTSLPLTLTQFIAGPNGGWVAQSTVILDVGSGFVARPTLQGDTVTVEILPQTETLTDPVSGRIDSSHLATTVSGRLGEWIPLGGINQSDDAENSGTGHYGTRGSLERQRILLKVEVID
jgi:type II secretory pathway component GspD/PulD (secretin)